MSIYGIIINRYADTTANSNALGQKFNKRRKSSNKSENYLKQVINNENMEENNNKEELISNNNYNEILSPYFNRQFVPLTYEGITDTVNSILTSEK